MQVYILRRDVWCVKRKTPLQVELAQGRWRKFPGRTQKQDLPIIGDGAIPHSFSALLTTSHFLSTVPYKQNGPDQWGLVKTCFLRLKTPKIHEKKEKQ